MGAGEKKCTRAPNTHTRIWTASALKTSQAGLLGLTFKAPYVLVPFFFASLFRLSLRKEIFLCSHQAGAHLTVGVQLTFLPSFFTLPLTCALTLAMAFCLCCFLALSAHNV